MCFGKKVNICCFVCTFALLLLERLKIHWELWCELLGEDGSSMDWMSSLVQALVSMEW